MVRYRDLRSNEIRVIKLFTDQDDPRFAFGPIHCSLEYVSLEKSHLNTNDGQKLLTKGCSSTWPCPTAEDIEAQPRWRDSLWRKSMRRKPSSDTETSASKPLSLDCLNRDVEINGEDAELPWRYEWGDYVALSYVWGDATVKRTIFVDGTPMAITQNLEAALYQLRNYPRVKQGFRIWADAVCINQDDLSERAEQVVRMKQIYASAWHIVIWLGAVSHDSDLAMTAMRYFSIRSREDNPFEEVYYRVEKDLINLPYMRWKHSHVSVAMRKRVFQALYYLLARTYFRRLWVLQEIASGARSTPVMCGTRCVLLDDIYRTLQLIRDVDGNELGRQIICSTKGHGGMRRSWDQLPAGIDTYTISEKLWERPIAMIEAQNVPQTVRKSAVHDDIFGALILSREANTSDDRDRIYGILGLPCLAAVVKIVPDYHLPAIYTYIIFAKSLFGRGDFNGLRLVASPVPPIDTKYFQPDGISRPRAPKFARCPEVVNPGCEHGLPSWVLCWSCPRNPAVQLISHASAALESYSVPPAFRDDKLMIIEGVLFDNINSLSAFHATESDRSYPFNGHEVRSIYGSEVGTLEALWRTITGNTTRSGAPLPPSWSIILEPRNWHLGLGSASENRNKIFGLNNFFARNKTLRLFDRTLAQLINDEDRMAEKSLAQRLRELTSEQDSWYWNGKSSDRQVLRDAMLRAMQVLAWRRLITTNEGYMGLAPAATRVGDFVAIVPGCDVPLVLRPEGNSFRVLGESYVHGMMSGKIVKMLEQGTKKMIHITLC
jgi:hypothetical protein